MKTDKTGERSEPLRLRLLIRFYVYALSYGLLGCFSRVRREFYTHFSRLYLKFLFQRGMSYDNAEM